MTKNSRYLLQFFLAFGFCISIPPLLTANSISSLQGNVGHVAQNQKTLLIGVTGGTGFPVVKSFLENSASKLRIMTRKLDNRPLIQELQAAGIEVVEADLEDEASLLRAMEGVDAIYCHGTSGDHSKADPAEVERGCRLARVAKSSNLRHFVYNSAGGREGTTGIDHIDQKRGLEAVFRNHELPFTFLRATLFMEEFWKDYTRPSVLKGKFFYSVNRKIQMISTLDMGRIASQVINDDSQRYIGTTIEVASDELTPEEMARAFSRTQDKLVRYFQMPAWIFLAIGRGELYSLIRWMQDEGYRANLQLVREEFNGLLTFEEFLKTTNWKDAKLQYSDLAKFKKFKK